MTIISLWFIWNYLWLCLWWYLCGTAVRAINRQRRSPASIVCVVTRTALRIRRRLRISKFHTIIYILSPLDFKLAPGRK